MPSLAALALTLLVLGCGAAAASDPEPVVRETGRPQGGLAVSVTATPAVARPGVPVRIVVTVRNTAGERRMLDATSGCLTDYELLATDGRVLASSGQECPQALTAQPLAAGDSLATTHVWVLGLRGMPSLDPGRYTVRGVLRLGTGELRSAPIPIEVAGGGG